MLSAVTTTAVGADAGSIQSTVDAFRTALGPLNANVNGSFTSGRREISWDGVPDATSAPSTFPENFFNTTSPRGVLLSTPGTGFQVSAKPGVGPIEFDNINAVYSSIFTPFSTPRLFTALGSTVIDVSFVVPGTSTPATVHGFGAVFTDVDNASGPNSTRFECFDQAGNSLGVFTAPAVSNGLSFVGVVFNAGERVGRVRITSGNTPLGAATNDNDGSVDLVVMDDLIFGEPRGNDMGDAPDTYKTVLVSDGARHVANSGLYLGNTVDVDANGQPTASATGDDLSAADDEDGVSFGTLLQGSVATITVTSSTNGRLDAFLDFNADGDFADAGEKVFSSQVLQAGGNTLQFSIPAVSAAGSTFARFRVSSAGGLAFGGQAADGEVEDYQVTITAPQLSNLSGTVYRDLNDNGVFDPTQGETGIAGVTVTLSGQTDQGTSLNIPVLTNANGVYAFIGLRPAGPGGYTITESQPAGIADGKDSVGSEGGTLGNDLVSGIVFSPGSIGINYNFGERPARLAGFVYRDNNGNGIYEPSSGEIGISGVTISLGGSAVGTTTTAADGTYSFLNLGGGVYSLVAAQPAGFVDGIDSLGSSGGVIGADSFTSVSVAAGDVASGYNFGERVGVAVNDITLQEGAAGNVDATFTLTLTTASNQSLSVNVTTADGTATTSGSDYFAFGSTVTVPAGATSQTFNVAVRGDLVVEPDETFLVNLSSPQGGALVDGQGSAVLSNDDPPTTTRMYRAYNANTNSHFFTTSKVQFDNAVAAGYRDETTGRAGFAILTTQPAGSVPIFRLYNFQTGNHYYTLNAAERTALINLVPPGHPSHGLSGWRDEGIEGYMFAGEQATTTRIYRLYNSSTGTHLFTENQGTRDSVLAQFPGIWVEHSALGFAFTIPAPTSPAVAESTAPAVVMELDSDETSTSSADASEISVSLIASPDVDVSVANDVTDDSPGPADTVSSPSATATEENDLPVESLDAVFASVS